MNRRQLFKATAALLAGAVVPWKGVSALPEIDLLPRDEALEYITYNDVNDEEWPPVTIPIYKMRASVQFGTDPSAGNSVQCYSVYCPDPEKPGELIEVDCEVG